MAQYHTNGNGRGLDDLYVLPESTQEHNSLAAYLKAKEIRYTMEVSDIEGQDWFEKVFFEIPFYASMRGSIEQHLAQID